MKKIIENAEDRIALGNEGVQYILEDVVENVLLSVKEMVESKKKEDEHGAFCDCSHGYNEALSELQSLLDEEINKVKEL